MSNYPDGFSGTNMDDSPEEEFPAEVRAIENAQLAYREIIEATIRILKRRGFTNYPRKAIKHSIRDISESSFRDIDDLLKYGVKEEFDRLQRAGYDYSMDGDDGDTFFDRMHALLKEGETAPALTGEALMQVSAPSVIIPVPNRACVGMRSAAGMLCEAESGIKPEAV